MQTSSASAQTVHGPAIDAAMQCAGTGDWAGARAHLERALASPRDRQVARFLLWEICQALRLPELAVDYLRDAVAENPLTSRLAAQPKRRVLALNVPGTFQANLPLAHLLNEADTELHTLWLHDAEAVIANPLRAVAQNLPKFDCAFIAIAEDSRHARALQAADRLIEALRVPVINNGARIGSLSREAAARLLNGIPNTIVPQQTLVARSQLAAGVAGLGELGLQLPLIVRPRHSHAGDGVARVRDEAEIAAFLDANKHLVEFYAAPFVDYSSADGQFRKYRVIFVDGQPMPYHLAIHNDWAIWYYNAGMEADAAKRAEEERFLADITNVFPPMAMAALRDVARRVDLDYFGLDCTLMPDGRLMMFEVETGMIVHDADPAEIYPYKKRYVPRIFRAVENLIDSRVAAAQAAREPELLAV